MSAREELHAAIDELSNERVERFAAKYPGECVCLPDLGCGCGRRGRPSSPKAALLDWLTRHTEA